MDKDSMPLNIILLGDPAAGKATQAAYLVKKYPLYDFDMGKELRKLRRKNTRLNQTLSGTTDKGKLTPTAVVRGILNEKIHAAPKSKGILFDGHPKMIGEARLAVQWLKETGRMNCVVMYLSIPLEETVRRMDDRVEYFKGKFSRRPDDSQAALKNRVKYYRNNIAAVVKFFQTKYPYKKISGLGNREEVRKRIDSFIKKHEARTH